MYRKLITATKFTAFAVMLLTIALGTAFAVDSYYVSEVVEKGKDGHFTVTDNDNGRAEIRIPKRSLDPYLDEQGVNEVEITCRLQEIWVDSGDGTGFYALDFTFGPSGTYFESPLILEIRGDYALSGADTWLYDENGEALPGAVSKNDGSELFFEIPHFSSYAYDDYSY